MHHAPETLEPRTMRTERDVSDEALAKRAGDGDQEAFRLLFERHAPALREQVRRRLPKLLRRKVAESDVLQMAYLSVHQSLENFADRGRGSFRAWLDKIVEHRILDVLRHYVQTSKRSLQREVSRPRGQGATDVPGAEPTPSVVAIGEELRRTIEAAMAQLPEDYKTVLHLVQGEGLALAEVAERMSRSAGAAKQLYARALNRLSEQIHASNG
jgi:RNA polymerase sigma-70 factor (ECF subfamily)